MTLKKKKAQRQVERLQYKLNKLGFTDRPLADLEALAADNTNLYRKRLASWELALWHANRYNEADARQALKYVAMAVHGETDPLRLRRATVIAAECCDILNDTQNIYATLVNELKKHPDANLFLATANLEPLVQNRIAWINKAFELYGLPGVKFNDSAGLPAFDSLLPGDDALQMKAKMTTNLPKVSVIMPVYNAAATIRTALKSVLSQTWPNLELLVVDDGSSDNTAKIVKKFKKKDSRIRLIMVKSNRGTYVARNLALREASGDFVTTHDADDWSHPLKIEKQVLHLLEHPSVVANTSQMVRVTPELKFHRRGNPGFYINDNMSSLMFRRVPVTRAIGYWDAVRFGADGEFKRRIIKVFGHNAVVDLPTGPLSFLRQSGDSLTGNASFGYHGFFMGARKEYFESYSHYHQKANSLYYPFPQKKRLFPVPEPLWPVREINPRGRRKFDVIIASDFRLHGGTTSSNAEEIKAQKQMGLRTGLIQMPRYDFGVHSAIDYRIRELLDGDRVQMLVYGEEVDCDVLIIRHPSVLQERQRYLPDVNAAHIVVVVNQPPKRDYSESGKVLYSIQSCVQNLRHYFGKDATWHPIGPLVRKALYEHHAGELQALNLSAEDWPNIINVKEWRRKERPPRGPRIKIGRHSRGQYVKWPADPAQLLSIYPESPGYEVHVLGGADTPKEILGRLPENWHVYQFGEMPPQEFLAMLDVFVYFTNADWVESFGRVIIEAMAVGVPVILPHPFRDLFGEAAVYAEPFEVKMKIDQLMADDRYYELQVQKAFRFVKKNFSYARHASRLNKLLVKR